MTSIRKTLLCTALIASLLVPHTAQADEENKPSLQKTIDWAVKICHDQSYGYSQEHRWGDGGYDCSSFVISAFWAGGFHLGYKDKYEGCTADIKRAFMEAGFDWYPAEELELDKGTIDLLLPGDVLLIDGYHAELYIGDGLTAAAHEDVPSEDHPNRSKDPGDQGDEVCVYEYVYHPWTGVLRYNAENDVISHYEEENEDDTESSSGSNSEDDSAEEASGSAEETSVSEEETSEGEETASESEEENSDSKEEASESEDGASESEDGASGSEENDETPLLPALFQVVADSLFVREGPGRDTPAVEYLKEGDQVIVTDLTGVWGHVTVCGVKGYVNMMYMNRVRRLTDDEPETSDSGESSNSSESSDYATKSEDSRESEASPSPSDSLTSVPAKILDEVSTLFYSVPVYPEGQVLLVNTETLYVRREPGSTDDPIYCLNEYDRVEILEQEGEWGKIKVGGIYGWINLRYCREPRRS